MLLAGRRIREGKKYAHAVNTIKEPRKKSRCNKPISFGDEDMKGVSHPHPDAFVITANIG